MINSIGGPCLNLAHWAALPLPASAQSNEPDLEEIGFGSFCHNKRPALSKAEGTSAAGTNSYSIDEIKQVVGKENEQDHEKGRSVEPTKRCSVGVSRSPFSLSLPDFDRLALCVFYFVLTQSRANRLHNGREGIIFCA